MLSSILNAVQHDPGHRGLRRDPADNLITATAGHFERACESLRHAAGVHIITGFFIPNATPPAFETDGPLGALALAETFHALDIPVAIRAEPPVLRAIAAVDPRLQKPLTTVSHVIFLERGGPGADGRRRTMRGLDITDHLDASLDLVPPGAVTIGIGDGGNEIGMGAIPHETIVKNIANGDLIHCRTPVDHLIVAGVSNWGAYALAAGIMNAHHPFPWFDIDAEQNRLRTMVTFGPLVDGVSGQPTPTVDGLCWADYTQPILAIRDILSA